MASFDGLSISADAAAVGRSPFHSFAAVDVSLSTRKEQDPFVKVTTRQQVRRTGRTETIAEPGIDTPMTC